MKYMTFNSSCSYAGLANLLSLQGYDAEDRKIALGMRLPYLFHYENGSYISGPMLQGEEWFSLYLKPIGFKLAERRLSREEACAVLRKGPPAMLGLWVSPKSKHAVICTGWRDGEYHFLNNKRQDSPEPETLCLTKADLMERLDGQVVTGTLERTAKTSVDYRSYLEKSVLVFRSLREKIIAFCAEERSAAALRAAMNELFRPILLDGVTMLELLEKLGTAEPLKVAQAQFLRIIKEARPAVLAEELDMGRLCAAMAQYEDLIIKQMGAE